MVIDTFFVNKKAVPTFTSSFSVNKNTKPKGLDLLPLLNRIQRVSGYTAVTSTNRVEPFVTSAKPFEAVMLDVITFEIDNNKLTADFIIYTGFLNNSNDKIKSFLNIGNDHDKINRMMMVNDEDLEFLQHVCSRVVS